MTKATKAPANQLPANAANAALRQVGAELRLVVHVKARSAREGFEEGRGGIVLRVAAAPVDGQANARVIELVARRLRVPRRAVTLVRGDGARDKELAICGLELHDARERLCGTP